MTNPERIPVVIDTNILFSSLLTRTSRLAGIILRGEQFWFVCDSVVVELFAHKERLFAHSQQTEEEILSALRTMLGRIRVYQEDLIAAKHWEAAYRLCEGVDASDTPHVFFDPD